MENIVVVLIILGIVSWIFRNFINPVAKVVATANNNVFIKNYILEQGISDAFHCITTLKAGNNSVITNVVISENAIHFPMRNGKHIIIPIDKIKYYTKEGEVSYTNQVYNAGRGISLGKAVVGGLIAGPIGAVIGGANGAEKFENETVIHDDTETFLYYFVNENDITVMSINGAKFYQNLKLRFPEKEYEYGLKHKENIKGTSIKYLFCKSLLRRVIF